MPKSVPQESLYEERFVTKSARLYPAGSDKSEVDQVINLLEESIEIAKKIQGIDGDILLERLQKQVDPFYSKTKMVTKPVRVEKPQPNILVPDGTFKPSQIEQAVKGALNNKKGILFSKFKETVWQQIKNALHIGKGHEARKQEHGRKFIKDNVKDAFTSSLPQGLLDKVEKIGKTTRRASVSEKKPTKSRPPSKSRGR